MNLDKIFEEIYYSSEPPQTEEYLKSTLENETKPPVWLFEKVYFECNMRQLFEKTLKEAKTTKQMSLLDNIDNIFLALQGDKDAYAIVSNHHFLLSKMTNIELTKPEIGLKDGYFTISYGTIARHYKNPKDADHSLTKDNWINLCKEISFPFAIAKNNSDALRLFVNIQINNHWVAVGVDIKNVGQNLFVNSISTVFGRKSGVGENYRLIYESSKITPEQKAFSEGHNPLS